MALFYQQLPAIAKPGSCAKALPSSLCRPVVEFAKLSPP